MLVIGAAALPIPEGPQRIDLVVTANLSRFIFDSQADRRCGRLELVNADGTAKGVGSDRLWASHPDSMEGAAEVGPRAVVFFTPRDSEPEYGRISVSERNPID